MFSSGAGNPRSLQTPPLPLSLKQKDNSDNKWQLPDQLLASPEHQKPFKYILEMSYH